MKFQRSSGIAVLLIAALASISSLPATAIGVRFVQLSPIPPAPQKITIDGRLDDWKGVDAFLFDPNQTGGLVRAGGNPIVDAMLREAPSVNIRTCYDSNALYLAIEWKDTAPGINRTPAGDADHWFEAGEGFELHVRTDDVLHIACWPTSQGTSVMTRRNAETAWHDASSQITAVGAPGTGPSAFVQEIRIPWAALSQAGTLPVDGKLELGADFAWNALDAKMIAALRQASVSTSANFPGFPFCFLTARPPKFGTAVRVRSIRVGSFENRGRRCRRPGGESTGADEPRRPTHPRGGPAARHGRHAGRLGREQLPDRNRPPRSLGRAFQCRFATQYDARNLYLAAHFPRDIRSPTSSRRVRSSGSLAGTRSSSASTTARKP